MSERLLSELTLLRESNFRAKSLETRIVSKRVELRNCKTNADSRGALRSQPLEGIEGSVPIPHPGKGDRLVIRELPGQLDDPLSFVASSNPPVSVPKITSNRSAERHAFGDARGQNLDAFAQSALSQSRAAETFISDRLGWRRPAPAIFWQLFTLGSCFIVKMRGKKHVG